MSGAAPDRPGFAGVFREVLWAFFGVRDRAPYDRATRARPWHILLAGLIATCAFVAILVTAVRLALRATGAS